MSRFFARVTLWAFVWCAAGITVSLLATSLGLADTPTVKAAIVAWILFIGTAISAKRLRNDEKNQP